MAMMNSYPLIYLSLFSVLVISCSSFSPRLFDYSDFSELPESGSGSDFTDFSELAASRSGSEWSAAGATWYGSPYGAGSDGGACGYANAVYQAPFNSLIAAGGPSLFKSGEGCGACYEVKCTKANNPACSGAPVRVVITDNCPGCPDATHFDLSGTAFGALAAYNQGDRLRNAGVLQVQYRRVPCHYHGVPMTFRVDPGSSPFYFAVVIEYKNGDGGLTAVALKPSNSNQWISMQRSWGAVWKLDTGSAMQAPFSLLLTGDSGRSRVVNNAIPAGWQPGSTYKASVNRF